ncbi:DUF6504 family protein [Glaciibacter sp. 2TAF33]|uniref:DUF6504 family protein n=1 Tax=Glaciibacter sp. 2TAF33 TaxID=3233015 RepID=UPI003F91116C
MSQIDEPVTVWTKDTGEPERLVWRTRRFRVTDIPTALVGPCDWWGPFSPHGFGIGHPPLAIAGWRFQATADDGETHVFDVHHEDDGAHPWRLMRIFD